MAGSSLTDFYIRVKLDAKVLSKFIKTLLKLRLSFKACLLADFVLGNFVHYLALIVAEASMLRDGAKRLANVDLIIKVFAIFKLSGLG